MFLWMMIVKRAKEDNFFRRVTKFMKRTNGDEVVK
jgi:hypothetical protein